MDLTAAEIADDFDVLDNRKTVTVQQINAQSGAVVTTAASVSANRGQITKTTVPTGDGDAVIESATWQLKQSTIAFVPKERDRIVDGADTWKIDSVRTVTFGTRYVCEATKVRG